jgi:hypothetical protein
MPTPQLDRTSISHDLLVAWDPIYALTQRNVVALLASADRKKSSKTLPRKWMEISRINQNGAVSGPQLLWGCLDWQGGLSSLNAGTKMAGSGVAAPSGNKDHINKVRRRALKLAVRNIHVSNPAEEIQLLDELSAPKIEITPETLPIS